MQEPEVLPSRLEKHRYVAHILGWHISGDGDSRSEAIQALEAEFVAAKSRMTAEGEPTPRPGVQVPIKFASQTGLEKHSILAEDFIHRVLQLDWAWISDESSLWHFHTNETNDKLLAKIKEVYGVDVSDIQSGSLTEILDRIASETNR
jgi:hypothetical protein